MSKVYFELNSEGVVELLNGPKMTKIIQDSTDRVFQAAKEDNDGYETEMRSKKDRNVGVVWADTPHARNSARAHNTLQKALRRGKVE